MASTEPRLHPLLAPEHRLLFGSAIPGYTASPGDVAQISDAAWGALRYTLEREKAAIAVARLLGTLDRAALPPDAQALQPLAMVMEFRMHHLRQRLAQSVTALQQAGIPCVVLKGGAVGLWYHASFVERPMLDLDLLVPADQAASAYEVLRNTGWITPAAERTVVLPAGGIHHLPALHDGTGMAVNLEVHTDIIPPGHPFRFSADDVWRDARAVPMATGKAGGLVAEASIPSATHMAVHACIHYAWQHMMRSGTWRTAKDLRVITADPTFSWTEFVALATSSRAASACYWTLRLVQGVAAVQVPTSVLSELRVSPPGGLPQTLYGTFEKLVERHLLAVLIPGGTDCPSVRMRRVAWECALRPHAHAHGDARPWRVGEEEPEGTHSAVGTDHASLDTATAATGQYRHGNVPRWREMARYARAVLRSSHPTAL